jgi:hypothetical protein
VTGVLLDRSHRLPGGHHVRLRLARPRDRDAVHALLAGLELAAEDLDVRRLLRCAPGELLAVCATAWDGSRERVIGLGTLAVRSGRATLLAGDPEVRALVAAGLREHAGAWARRVA